MYSDGVAQALIRIDQAANSIPIGVPGVSRDDIRLGQVVTLRNGNTQGVRSRRWVLDPAPGSMANLSTTDGEAPSFTPDVFGTYLVKLSVNGGLDLGELGDEVDERTVIVRDPAGHRHPHTKEAAESNYQVAPGVFNKEGWSPDIRRMLMSFDNRGQVAFEVTVAGGGTEYVDVVMPSNMTEGVLQFLRVFTSSSDDTTIRIGVAGLVVSGDYSSEPGIAYRQNMTIINEDGRGFPDNTFTIEVKNNAGASSDYQIWLRVKAT